MIIKVCGIKTVENVHFLSKANIDMVGLNFYKPSIRYLSNDIPPSRFDPFDAKVKRVGVFVNKSQECILTIGKKFKLDYAQLHGDEDPEFCELLSKHIPIIKVFRVDEHFDFSTIKDYNSADFFLFDTQTKNYGGSGKKFDWKKLNQYKGSQPFLLSGGIGPLDINEIMKIHHPQFAGIDINSKFESEPGVKDKNMVLSFLSDLEIKSAK